jgi:hypothetical protein
MDFVPSQTLDFFFTAEIVASIKAIRIDGIGFSTSYRTR